MFTDPAHRPMLQRQLAELNAVIANVKEVVRDMEPITMINAEDIRSNDKTLIERSLAALNELRETLQRLKGERDFLIERGITAPNNW